MDWKYFAFNAQQTFFWWHDKILDAWRDPVDDNWVVLYKTEGWLLIPDYVSREDKDHIPYFPSIEDIVEIVKQKKIWILYTTEIGDRGFRWLNQIRERTDREEFLEVLWENYADHIRWIGAKVITIGR